MALLDTTGTKIIPAKVQTTDATVTTCGTYTIPDESCLAIRVIIIGIEDSTGDCVVYHGIAAAQAESGARSMLGTVTNVSGSEATFEDAGLTAASWTLDISGNDLRVRVTGQAGKTIDWQSTMEVTLFKP